MASLTPGYSFGSTEQVTNSKLATLVSGATVSSIVDADISSGASITLSKINITAASINYDRLNLGGNIVNADINASAAIAASKINLGSSNQGDIFVDTGSGITRLTAGTNGQYLQTQGASANPQWDTIIANGNSNVLYAWSGNSVTPQIYNSTSLNPTTGPNYLFYSVNTSSGAYATLINTYILKTAGFNTLTCYANIWGATSAKTVACTVTTDSITGTSNTVASATPTWTSAFTLNISSLTNGTAYPLSIAIAEIASGSGWVYLSDIIIFGS